MMKINFEYEADLVLAFINSYSRMAKEVVIKEMPIRYGNIDVVSIKKTELPFTDEQILILSKPSNALLFTKVKNERPISKQKIIESVGLSDSTISGSLCDLMKYGLIIKKDNNYLRGSSFVFPKTTVTGYEAKLKDFNKAFYQAKSNKEYVDYSYLVFPMEIAKRILKNKLHLLDLNGLGLIGVSNEKSITLYKARKTKGVNNYMRLLNIAKANTMKTQQFQQMIG